MQMLGQITNARHETQQYQKRTVCETNLGPNNQRETQDPAIPEETIKDMKPMLGPIKNMRHPVALSRYVLIFCPTARYQPVTRNWYHSILYTAGTNQPVAQNMYHPICSKLSPIDSNTAWSIKSMF